MLGFKPTIVISKDCPVCKEVKRVLEEKKVEFDVIDVDTEDGAKFAKEHNIDAVPECFVITKSDKGDEVRQCTVKEMDDLVKEQ